jgi:putative FmdB family regulatory protein
MPTYEYECTTCHHHFDAVQKMADPPLTECPECGKSVHRVLSGGLGIIFQGPGFYVNDSHAHQKSEAKPSAAQTETMKAMGERPLAEKPEGAKPAGEKTEKLPGEKAVKPEKPAGEKPKEKNSAVA